MKSLLATLILFSCFHFDANAIEGQYDLAQAQCSNGQRALLFPGGSLEPKVTYAFASTLMNETWSMTCLGRNVDVTLKYVAVRLENKLSLTLYAIDGINEMRFACGMTPQVKVGDYMERQIFEYDGALAVQYRSQVLCPTTRDQMVQFWLIKKN